MAFLIVSPIARRDVEQLPAVWGLTISRFESAFTLFNLVIRLSKVKQMAFFHCLTCRSSRCWRAARCLGTHHFSFWHWGVRSCFQVWWLFLLWSLVRCNCAPNSQGDHLSHPEGFDLNLEGLEPYHDSCKVLRMHHICFNCWLVFHPDISGFAMFPFSWQFPLVPPINFAWPPFSSSPPPCRRPAVPPCHVNTPCRAVCSQHGTFRWLWFSVGGFKWFSCTQHQSSLLAYLFSTLQSHHAFHPFRKTFWPLPADPTSPPTKGIYRPSCSLAAILLFASAAPHECPLLSCSFSARHLWVTVNFGWGPPALCHIAGFSPFDISLPCFISSLPLSNHLNHHSCPPTFQSLPADPTSPPT